MLPSIFNLGQHITNFESNIFNNDLDDSHYIGSRLLFSDPYSQALCMYPTQSVTNQSTTVAYLGGGPWCDAPPLARP